MEEYNKMGFKFVHHEKWKNSIKWNSYIMQSGRIQSDGICTSCKRGEYNKMGFVQCTSYKFQEYNKMGFVHHAKWKNIIRWDSYIMKSGRIQ